MSNTTTCGAPSSAEWQAFADPRMAGTGSSVAIEASSSCRASWDVGVVNLIGEVHVDPECIRKRREMLEAGVRGEVYVGLEDTVYGSPGNDAIFSTIPGYSSERSRLRGLESDYPVLLSFAFIMLHMQHHPKHHKDPKYVLSFLQRIQSGIAKEVWESARKSFPLNEGFDRLAHAVEVLLGSRGARATYTLLMAQPPAVFAEVARIFARGLFERVEGLLAGEDPPAELLPLHDLGGMDAMRNSLENPMDNSAYERTVQKITFDYREMSMRENLVKIAEEARLEGKAVTACVGQGHFEVFAEALERAGVRVNRSPYSGPITIG